MPTLPFGEWRPDLSDLDGEHTRSISGVLPRGDGYGPVKEPLPFTNALPAACRGYFYARKRDGSVAIFAGTATKLYLLNAMTYTWDDVSAGGGSYTTLNTGEHWQFGQFGDLVIAVQANAAPQSYNLTSSSQFAALGGSPPQARYIAIVGSFVVLSGLNSEPYRTQWSGLGNAINWTAGTGSSDFQDLPDGGICRQVLGGEVGFILQDLALRRMVFAPGSDVIFVIEKVAKDIGLVHPYAAAAAGDKIFFLTPKGFMQTDAAGALLPIGAERVDRTFAAAYDDGAPGFVIAAADPKTHVVVWTYRTKGMTDELFDAAYAYNWLLKRWAPFPLSGEYLTSLAQPGVTIEGLDAVAPGAMAVTGAANNGAGLIRITVASTSTLVDGNFYTLSAVGGVPNANGTFEIDIISGTTFDLIGSTFAGSYTSGGIVGGFADLMETSWDAIASATLPNLSIANSAHKIALFTGDNLEAVLETPEQSGEAIEAPGQRLLVDGFFPITDADTVYGRVGHRERLHAAFSYTDEAGMESNGYVPNLISARFARGKIRIPAATAWTFATGVRPQAQADGEA